MSIEEQIALGASPKKTESKISAKKVKEAAAKILFLIAAIFAIFAVLAIIGFLFFQGIPAMRRIGLFNFLFGTIWHPEDADMVAGGAPLVGDYGLAPMIVGSLYTVAGALIVGGILGIFTAVFLSSFCPKKIKPVLRQIVNLLAGIPSVIFGFFGMMVIVPLLGGNYGILPVSIILGIMILPTIAAISTSGIEAVDRGYYEGAVALGATKSQAIFKVVVPAAKSTILASTILGVGRSIGETMAVILVAGNNPVMPRGLLTDFRTLTANIVMEMAYATQGGLTLGAMIATGCVLVVFILIINTAFMLVMKDKDGRGKKRKKEKAVAMASCPSYMSQSAVSDTSSPVLMSSAGVGVLESGSTVMKSSESLVKEREIEGDEGENEDIGFSQKIKEFFKKIGRGLKTAGYYISWPFRKAFQFVSEISFSKVFNKVFQVLAYVATAIAVAMLLFIIIFVLINGLPHIMPSMFSANFVHGGRPSILPSIVALLMMLFLGSIIAFPLGIAAAIFLNEYTKKGSKLVKVIRMAIDILAGIPSVVFGLFGAILFVNILRMDLSIMAGALTIALMSIPVTVRAVEEALKAVPDSYREGSFALGAGKLRTVYKVVLPPAIPGIFAAIILGIGRMCAETAALMFTMGASLQPMPTGFMSPGTTLAVAFFSLIREGMHQNEAFATGGILIMLVLTLNIISTLMVAKLQKKLAGAEKKAKKRRMSLKAILMLSMGVVAAAITAIIFSQMAASYAAAADAGGQIGAMAGGGSVEFLANFIYVSLYTVIIGAMAVALGYGIGRLVEALKDKKSSIRKFFHKVKTRGRRVKAYEEN